MKPWSVKLSWVLIGAVLGATFSEIGLRIARYSFPNFYQSDEYRGAAHPPTAEGWWRKEGEAYIRINSAGLRDREHAKFKPQDVVRIAVLGDSYAEALQVPMEEAFCAVMERELRRSQVFGNREVEVINFGVAGYGTAQELLTLHHFVWDYSPDIVILAFMSGNDIRNNVRALEQDPMRPYFVFHNENLVLDASFRNTFAWRFRHLFMHRVGYWILNHSRLLQLLNEVRYHVESWMAQARHSKYAFLQTKDASAKVGEPMPGTEVGLDNMIYFEPVVSVWKEAWRVTESLILLMRDEVKEKGAAFLVVTLTNNIQVDPNPVNRSAFMEWLHVQDLFYPDYRIRALGERSGFPVLNLAPPLQEYAEQHRVLLHGFQNGGGHWNSEGHSIAGKLIADEICSEFTPVKPMVRCGRK